MGHLRSEVDGYTLAQAALFLEEGAKQVRRDQAMLAQFVIACFSDAEAWKSMTKDL